MSTLNVTSLKHEGASGDNITLSSNGNVGIGSTAPSTNKLHIESAGATRAVVYNSSNAVGVRIQAETGSGLVQTDTNHPLRFATNNGAVQMQIDTAGRVTMPYQPSFLAVSNSGDTTVTANTAIPLNVAAYNVGSCYNTSTYRFTAPVSGKYLFTSCAYYTSSGGNTQSMQVAPFINGSQHIPSGGGDAVLFSAATPNSTGSIIAVGSSVILNLSAGDYVTMAARSNNGRFYLGHTSFSGQLIS